MKRHKMFFGGLWFLCPLWFRLVRVRTDATSHLNRERIDAFKKLEARNNCSVLFEATARSNKRRNEHGTPKLSFRSGR